MYHSLSCLPVTILYSFFFFNDTATTEIYTLSLHDALPILPMKDLDGLAYVHFDKNLLVRRRVDKFLREQNVGVDVVAERSEAHTSELQSPDHLVCRLLLEKKKKNAFVFWS